MEELSGVNEKTTTAHWESVWHTAPRMRLPSSLNPAVRNAMRVLKRKVAPGMKYLEIGCAPGKLLAWVAKVLGAQVAGLDYTENGIQFARRLFETLDIPADLRCEDVFKNTFAPGSFDFVFSNGVIEHFDDPREIVRKHVELAKPGGSVLIFIPNYGGIYGRLARHTCPELLAMHNLAIMNLKSLAELAPRDLVGEVSTYHAGRLSPALLNARQRFPQALCTGTAFVVAAIAHLQPFDIAIVCPHLVLEMKRKQVA